jgi:DNA-binding transcriptional LysR family regulator
MDRLDELTIFVSIIDAGSLAGAARRLRRSAPAVTRALTALEERVGARLIERTTRRLTPTDAGRELAAQARRLIADYETAVSGAAAAEPHGLLRITAPRVFGRLHVAPVVTSFLDRYPGVSAELLLNDRNVDLIEEDLHVAVRIGPMADSRLVARRVGEVRRVVVASPAYLSARGTPMRPDELPRHETIIGFGVIDRPEWRFGTGARGPVIRLTPRLIVNDVDATLTAVRAGRGIGRALSYQVAEDLAAGSLVRLLTSFEPAPLPVQLVVSSGRHMAPKVRAFLDHAAATLERLAVLRPQQTAGR